MTLQNALNHFRKLKSGTTKKAEISVSTTNNKRHFTRALRQFQKYLKNDFSLITKRYYTKMGMGLGASFGVVFGIVVLPNPERSLGIAMGVALGMAIGSVIGHHLDSQAAAAGKVL